MTQTLEKPRIRRQRDGINHVVFSADGSSFVYSDVHMNLVFPNGVTRSLTSINPKVKAIERIRAVAISQDGTRVSATAGDQVFEFSMETGEMLWSYSPPRNWGFLIVSPLALAASHSGLLAASTDNGQILIWPSDRSSMRKLRVNDNPWQMFFAGNSEELVIQESFTVSRIDLESGEMSMRFELPDKCYGMALSPDGSMIAVRTLSRVYLLDGYKGRVIWRRQVQAGLPLLAFNPATPMLAVGENYFVSLLDLDGKEIDQVSVQHSELVSMGFHPSGSELVLGLSNHEIVRHAV